MASVKNIDLNGGRVVLTMTTSPEEYRLLESYTTDILLLPGSGEFLQERLTTGKLGNGNRIMVPNKLLERHEIGELKKKVPARLFDLNGEKYLLLKLEESSLIPEFKEEEEG